MKKYAFLSILCITLQTNANYLLDPSVPIAKKVSANKKVDNFDLQGYIDEVNYIQWHENMKVNTAMTVKIQALLDWNHASVGAIDGGFGDNTKRALTNFQKINQLVATGRMDEATWQKLWQNFAHTPIITKYTITSQDVAITTSMLPKSFPEQAQQNALPYQSVAEMLAERFHMDINYLKKINPDARFTAGKTINVINQPNPLTTPITSMVASKADKTLYAYHQNMLIASFPATIGNVHKSAPEGVFDVEGRIDLPWYKYEFAPKQDSTSKKSQAKANHPSKNTTLMLPPGANNPYGLVGISLSDPTCVISGMELPEIVTRLDETGCIKLTNWDALTVADNVYSQTFVAIR